MVSREALYHVVRTMSDRDRTPDGSRLLGTRERRSLYAAVHRRLDHTRGRHSY